MISEDDLKNWNKKYFDKIPLKEINAALGPCDFKYSVRYLMERLIEEIEDLRRQIDDLKDEND